MVTMALNIIALWKQEARNPLRTNGRAVQASFAAAWRGFAARRGSHRFLVAVGLGTAGFSMQDILLEPYGGEIMGLPVAATTRLTAFMACGTLLAFAFAARRLARGARSVPAGRRGRAGRHRGVQRGDLCRDARVALALPARHVR